ncbi:MAG TPA: four-helix bundle copper-binding protein [Trueperaceae bacterium]
MRHTADILASHPNGRNELEAVQASIEACFDCAQACTSCADACLGEENVQAMVRCIRQNLDCADVCQATGRLASRQTETSDELLRAQLQACVTACRVCAAECEKHSAMEHCRVCARACRNCEEACQALLQVPEA